MSRPFQEEKRAGGFGLDRSRRRSQARGDGAVCPSGQGGPEKENRAAYGITDKSQAGAKVCTGSSPRSRRRPPRARASISFSPGMTTTRHRLWR